MDIKLITHGKGVWVFLDDRHKKTFPKKYLSLFDKVSDKLNFHKKRLSVEERRLFELANCQNEFDAYVSFLKKSEKHLFLIVKNSKPIGVREVIGREGKRYEMKFDNNLFLKIPKRLYSLYPEKLKIAHLNY